MKKDRHPCLLSRFGDVNEFLTQILMKHKMFKNNYNIITHLNMGSNMEYMYYSVFSRNRLKSRTSKSNQPPKCVTKNRTLKNKRDDQIEDAIVIKFQNKFVRAMLTFEIDILTSKYLSYYFSQMGEEHFFFMIIEECGFEFEEDEDRVYIEWNDFRTCVENEHSLDTMFLNYTDFQENKASGLTLTFDEHQDEREFMVDDSPSLKRFGDLCRIILKRPTAGYHLICRVHGDKLMIPVLRTAFMDSVAVYGLSLSVEKHGFSNLETRFKTFKDYLTSFDASDEDTYMKYAEAGFLMTTSSELGMCFKCGGLVIVDGKVDPWYKHACWHPRCKYLREQKGTEFINQVRAELRRTIERSDSYVLEFRIDKLINNDNDDDDSDSDDEYDSESDVDSALESGSENDYFSD